MKNPQSIVASVLVLLALHLVAPRAATAAPGAHGPGGEHLSEAASPSASGLARLADGSVNVPKLSQRRMNVRTQFAPLGEAPVTVALPGRVVMDAAAGGRVQPAHGGRIEAGPKGLPIAGQAVARGEVLAYLRHHADPFSQANQAAQVVEIRAQRRTAEARVNRLKGLEGTVPRKDLLAAEAELQSLIEREARLGASLTAREPLISPATGVLARADVVLGQMVEPRDVLFEVVDPARALIEVTTSDAGLAGQIAGASLVSDSTAAHNASASTAPPTPVKLTLVGAARSLRDGVLPIIFRASAASAGGLPLALGQSVTVIVESTKKLNGIVLPKEAITRNPANEPVVWIKAAAERFIPQAVEYQVLDANRVVVTRGLGADNRVVIAGASLIAQIR
jgi:membrane fusion protein, heavy metal efflux system